MTNAEIIVRALDELLDHEVSLVIYGRAAIALGFSNPPEAVGRSMDVDVILRFSDAAQMDADDQFWNAQAEVNRVLDKSGLYMTHLFTEGQVFLRRDWEAHIVPITTVVLRWLKLFRPATVDLILTKMMRGNDEQDLSDISFMIKHDKVSRAQLEDAMLNVIIPDSQELRDAFEKARPHVLAMAS
jgi:hypothetical protein